MNATEQPKRPRLSLPNLRDEGIRRLFAYVKPYRWQVIAASLLTLISSGVFLVFPLVSGQLVNSVTGVRSALSPAQVIGVLVAIFLVRAVVDIGSQYLLAFAGESVIFDLRRDVYTRMQSLGLDFFNTRRTGELTARLASDTAVVRATLVTNLANFVSQLFTLVGSVALIVSINWRLTAVVVVVFPLATVVARLYSRSLRPLSTKVQDLSAESSAISEEAISGVRVVKSFGREEHEIGKYLKAGRELFETSLKLARIRASFGPLIGLMFFFALVGILWFGSQEVSAGRLTAGDLVAFLLYGGTVAGGVSSIASTVSQFSEAVGATKRLFEILDMQPQVQDQPGAYALPKTNGQITFEAVGFAYENNFAVISDVSLEIAPGEILALVGPSGAGKSTLFNLIPRFYDPTHGSIKLDGHGLRTLQVKSLRDHIAIVPQDTVLFSGSVLENILYGKLDANEAEVIAAAQAANAHDFILKLPQGYDTKVGERGVKLSGGQRQRVAIARAILKDPRILLLDEATSALDSESEGLVQEALERLMQNRTTIIIAHRLSTVHIAHRIAVLDQGQLAELGTHDALMAQQGLYHRLYSLQFKDDDDAPVSPSAEATGLSNKRTPTRKQRGFNPLQAIGR